MISTKESRLIGYPEDGADGRQADRPPRSAEALRSDLAVADVLRWGGRQPASGPLLRQSARSVKANLSINAGVLAAIDAEAARLGVSRSALVETMARRALSSTV